MKVVILCGGLGTRLSEETVVRPKPMVEIGNRPILWHIMHRFAAYGFKEFVLALGYKGDSIKHYFLRFHQIENDLRVDLATGHIEVSDAARPVDWRVQLVDTGQETQTGGRLKRLAGRLRDGTFLMTYGDGLADVDIDALVRFHRSHGRLATVTAVRPPARFGAIIHQGDEVLDFSEKPPAGEYIINGGFFVLEPGVLDLIDGDGAVWERDVLPVLARQGELRAYRHYGFWQPMDTLREKNILDSLARSGTPPWMKAP